MPQKIDVIVVPDTLSALGQLASYHRQRLNIPVLAITGSNGKTTTKEMVASLLKQKHSVWVTPGNYNNLIGLPFTLLGLEKHHEWCVAEMGMNARGEIARMVDIAQPVIRMVTNVGPAHIGELGSLEEIARAKGEIYLGGEKDSQAIINADDLRVVSLDSLKAYRRRRTFGSMDADVQVLNVESTALGLRVTLRVDDEEGLINIPLQGHHNALNAAGAIAAATAVTPLSLESIREGFKQLPAVAGRLSTRKVGSFTVVDDSYNANLVSALSAVRTAADIAGKARLVVAFGEMRELGPFSDEAHRQVGRELDRVGAAVVAAFGHEAKPVIEAMSLGQTHHEAQDFEALMHWLVGHVQEGDVVLLKGSRGSRMERVVEYLEGKA